jgi:hypothetical protein
MFSAPWNAMIPIRIQASDVSLSCEEVQYLRWLSQRSLGSPPTSRGGAEPAPVSVAESGEVRHVGAAVHLGSQLIFVHTYPVLVN